MSSLHSGGYWLLLLQDLEDCFVYYYETAKEENPRDIEFKLLLKFIELKTQKPYHLIENLGSYLPFANLTADFDKKHGVTGAIKRKRKP